MIQGPMTCAHAGIAMWQLVMCMQILFLNFCFLLKGAGWGGTHLCKCYDCEGKRYISNFVIVIYFQYFYIFGFCKVSLTFVWVRQSRNMYIKCSYVQILCLVSYMLRLFFQKITWIYANWVKNKDVQNKNIECVLYLVQHLSNKTGKCIHS